MILVFEKMYRYPPSLGEVGGEPPSAIHGGLVVLGKHQNIELRLISFCEI